MLKGSSQAEKKLHQYTYKQPHPEQDKVI
jgi:hypothetical protein